VIWQHALPHVAILEGLHDSEGIETLRHRHGGAHFTHVALTVLSAALEGKWDLTDTRPFAERLGELRADDLHSAGVSIQCANLVVLGSDDDVPCVHWAAHIAVAYTTQHRCSQGAVTRRSASKDVFNTKLVNVIQTASCDSGPCSRSGATDNLRYHTHNERLGTLAEGHPRLKKFSLTSD
jgi:hypothetical protein